MAAFKVALIDKSADEIPAWVAPALAAAGIDFAYGHCQSGDDLAAMAHNADVVWIYGGSRLAAGENLDRLPQCCAVIRSGSGVDRIDVAGATARGMVVVNTPHAHIEAVSEHAIALIFAVGRRLAEQDRLVRRGGWEERAEFLPLWRLDGQTVGLVGFGHIPRALVRKLRGFDVRILAADPFVDAAALDAHGVTGVDFPTLLAESDIISIHTPLTAETHHLFNRETLAQMKPGAMLINTARGPVIQESALADALQNGPLRGAGLDVFEEEPPGPDSPLFALDNVLLTPHTAGFDAGSIDATWRLSVEACLDLQEGFLPRSYVNRTVTPRRPLQPTRRTV